MTNQEWFVLSSPADFHGEFAVVIQLRKMFLLGSAFLRRVWPLLPAEAERTAVETTEQYARGQTSARDLLETWNGAEAATRSGVWVDENTAWRLQSGCPCCEVDFEQEEVDAIHPGVREAFRDPAWFAARAACYARELAGPPDSPTRQAETLAQFDLYRDIVGDSDERPRRAHPCATFPMVRRLLCALKDSVSFDAVAMLALADALEEAGCTEQPLLDHCRQPGPHGAGCWVVEVLRGRAGRTLPGDEETPWPAEERTWRW